MNLRPLRPYFIIKISKQAQKEKREKQGMIYLSPSHIHMKREVQYGEIVSIGEDAHDTFPEAEVGDILLCHHFTSGKESEGTDEGKYHIESDKEFNYYTVSCFSYNGRGNECYGVYKNNEIIPHPDFIFLEGDKPVEPVPVDQFIDKKFENKGGILVAKVWQETREEKGARMEKLKYESQELARTTKFDENGKEYMPEEIKKAIEEKEAEMNLISKDVNAKKYIPFKVEWPNSELAQAFGEEIKRGDTVYSINQASNTQIDFMGINYRVVKINYISCTEKWLQKARKNFHKLKATKELA